MSIREVTPACALARAEDEHVSAAESETTLPADSSTSIPEVSLPALEPEAVADAIRADASTLESVELPDTSEGLHIDLPDSTPTIRVAPPQEPQRASAHQHKHANLGELRMDVARITSDIQSGERLYQRAQQRVESLMEFVERAEVDFSLLKRLEPENRRLKARNRTLESENASAEHERRRLEDELAKSRAEAESADSHLKKTDTRLTTALGQLSQRDITLSELAESLEETRLKLERTQTSVDVESRENVVLRDQILELSERLDAVTSERMEFAKIIESLKIDCEDFRSKQQQTATEAADLRTRLAKALTINGEMKTQMLRLREQVKAFKTQYEFKIISRDDRIANLETRIADMTQQLAIKDDVATTALADIAQLRKARSAQDLERERLERVIETQQRQLDDAQAQIRTSATSMAELDRRYTAVTKVLGDHQARMNAHSTGDIPAGEAMTADNVERMIRDYKDSLRSEAG